MKMVAGVCTVNGDVWGFGVQIGMQVAVVAVQQMRVWGVADGVVCRWLYSK